MTIRTVRDRISRSELEALARETYVEMIKAVADVRAGVVAFGGDLHADAEAELLAAGSHQEDLWGFNIHFSGGLADGLEYTSLINIRPRDGNKSLQITSPALREKILGMVTERVDWEH